MPTTKANVRLNVHFLWFVGHVSTVILTFLHTVLSLIRPVSPSTAKLYKFTIYSIILNYTIVVCKTYSIRTITKIIFSKPTSLLQNTNTLYLGLSILFLSNYDSVFKYVQTSLYSFAIYSFFHGLNYFNTNLIPYIGLSMKYRNLLADFAKNYYEHSLYIAANCELYILIQLVFANLKNLVFIYRIGVSDSLRTVAVTTIFTVFIRIRYENSVHMKNVVAGYDMKINQFLYEHPRIPVLPTAYGVVRGLLMR